MIDPTRPGPPLTLEDVAEWLRISTRQVRRLIENGELPAIEISPRCRLVLRTDLMSFLAARKTGSGRQKRNVR